MAMLVGCERPRTELVVRVDSEVAWGPEQSVQSVQLTVRRGGSTGPLRSSRVTVLGTESGRQPLPLYVGVIEGDNDTDTPVWIEALGCATPNGCETTTAVVAQRAVVRFVRGQTQEVPLLLASACVRVRCPSDQRCAVTSGECEAATRAQELVRPYAGASDAGAATDVRRDGGERIDGGGCVTGACGPSHGWSQRFGLRRTESRATVLAVDATGNIFIGGSGAAGVTFGGAPIVAPVSASFVASFTPDGRPRWFRQLGTDGSVTSLVVDATGNLYVAGNCQAAVDLGGGPMAGAAADTSGTYLGSFTSTGAHRWSRRFDGTHIDDLAVDGRGRLVGVGFNGTGSADGNVDFGGGSSTGGPRELFVASFGLDGVHRWSRHFGRDDTTPQSPSVSAGADGTICITGSHNASLDFGGGALRGDGTTQPFVACLDPDGLHRWSRRYESDGNGAYSYGVAIDPSGNPTVTGFFWQAIDFGGGPLRSGGSVDIFVASFTSTGAHRWSRGFGGAGADACYGMSVDDAGAVFVTGAFQGTLDFGGAPVVSAGQRDAFVASISATGEPLWIRRYGAALEDFGFNVTTSRSNVLSLGAFNGDVDFGGGVLSSVGNRDVFLISLVR
jgi:hypothetical protein